MNCLLKARPPLSATRAMAGRPVDHLVSHLNPFSVPTRVRFHLAETILPKLPDGEKFVAPHIRVRSKVACHCATKVRKILPGCRKVSTECPRYGLPRLLSSWATFAGAVRHSKGAE